MIARLEFSLLLVDEKIEPEISARGAIF